MDDNGLKLTIDETPAIDSLNRLIKKFTSTQAVMAKAAKTSEQFGKALEDSTKEGAKGFTALNKQMDDQAKKLLNAAGAYEKLARNQSAANQSVREYAKHISIAGINLGEVLEKGDSYIKFLKLSKDAVSGNTAAFRTLKGVLAGLGVGLIVQAVSALVVALQKSEKATKFMNDAMQTAKATVSVLGDRFSSLSSGIIQAFREPRKIIQNFVNGLTRIPEILKDSVLNRFKSFGRIIEGIKSGSLTEIGDGLTQLVTGIEAPITKVGNFFNDVGSAAKNFYSDVKDREEELAMSAIERGEKEIEQYKRRKAEADKAAQADKERIEKFAREYVEIINGVEKRIADAGLDKLTGVERLQAERDIAIAETELLETKAKEAAAAAGLIYEDEKKFYQLRVQIFEGFKKRIDELKAERAKVAPLEKIETKDITVTQTDKGKAESEGVELGKAVGEGVKKGVEISNPLDVLKDQLASAFDLDRAEFDQVLGGLSTVFDVVKENYLANIDAQLEANSKLLDSIREQSDTVREELDKQLEYKEQGYANDVSLNKARLAKLEADEKKAVEQQRKLQKQREAVDTAEQITSLITATANIFKGYSTLPLIGQILAIAAVGSMFATFAATKARARNAARAYKGGPIADYLKGERSGGFVDRGGASDIYGRGDGYAVEGTNLRLGGDEFVMSEGPSKEHSKFLRRMNKGKYRGMDLGAMIKGLPPLPNHTKALARIKQRQATIDELTAKNRNDLIRDGISQAFERHTDKLIGYMKSQTHIAPLSKEGYIEYRDGHKNIVELRD